MEYDIFISYSRADSDIVDTVVQRLESAGYKVWIDKAGIYTGARFKSVLVKAIEDSKVFLFFSSENSNASPWTAKEIGIAANRNKTIIPVKIDDTRYNPDVEFDLINLDYIDYCDKSTRDQVINKLMRTLYGILRYPPPPPWKGEESGWIEKLLKKFQNRSFIIAFSLVSLITAIAALVFFTTYRHNSGTLSSPINESTIEISGLSFTNLIDLGLPSGTLWADRNLGASSPEDYGLHFAWGETEPKEEYSLNSYLYEYISDEGESTGKPRIEVDENYDLISKFDAATVLWGSRFRMPTSAQMLELIRYCKWKKVNDCLYQVIGTDNKSFMYLPLVEHIDGREYYDTFYYWTSTKRLNKADVLTIDTINKRITVEAYPDVFLGCPIRPVFAVPKALD